MKTIPTFMAENGDFIQFFRVTPPVPGYSHRVTINRAAVDWLSDNSRPSKKTAEYFHGKHTTTEM